MVTANWLTLFWLPYIFYHVMVKTAAVNFMWFPHLESRCGRVAVVLLQSFSHSNNGRNR